MALLRVGSAGTVLGKKTDESGEECMFVRVHGIADEILQGFSIALLGNAPSELKETIEGSRASHREVVDAIYSHFSLPPIVP